MTKKTHKNKILTNYNYDNGFPKNIRFLKYLNQKIYLLVCFLTKQVFLSILRGLEYQTQLKLEITPIQ